MLGKPKITVQRARQLRRTMSLPEVLLWQELRHRPGGLRFRRQHPAGPFVLDFYCPAAKLCVEVDGTSHDFGDRPARDSHRDAFLTRNGICTLRIPATDVLNEMEDVLRLIVTTARQ